MRLLVVGLVLAGFVAGCALRRADPPPSPHCRSGSPLVGVYHPERLKVKSRCRVAVGTVEKVKAELYDGDIHIGLRLDPGQDGLLSSGNARVGGTLILEIIPPGEQSDDEVLAELKESVDYWRQAIAARGSGDAAMSSGG